MALDKKVVSLDDYRSTAEVLEKTSYFKSSRGKIGIKFDDGFTRMVLEPCSQPGRMRLQLSNNIGQYITSGFDRKSLAEFVQIVSVYLDPDAKYLAACKLIALDYDDE